MYDERDRDDHDPRDALIHDVDLPRGEKRELVVDRGRVYELNGEDSRTLAAVGTFRVGPEQDLDTDHDTFRHLRDEGLVNTVDLGSDERGLTLTKEGRELLDSHTLEREDGRQAFHGGVSRPREIGTLFIGDGKPAERAPSGIELAAMFRDVTVTENEITSEAEWHYKRGDTAAYEAAAREARDSGSSDDDHGRDEDE